jgi:hypothetical protein
MSFSRPNQQLDDGAITNQSPNKRQEKDITIWLLWLRGGQSIY